MNVGSDKLNADSGILSEPFVFLRNGRYSWNSTGLYGRNSYGAYWSSHSNGPRGANHQSFTTVDFYPENGGNKGYGFAVRCVAR